MYVHVHIRDYKDKLMCGKKKQEVRCLLKVVKVVGYFLLMIV